MIMYQLQKSEAKKIGNSLRNVFCITRYVKEIIHWFIFSVLFSSLISGGFMGAMWVGNVRGVGCSILLLGFLLPTVF